MKAGILTFHNARNYGAVLQAWATQEFLLMRGIDAEVIDYRSPVIESSYRVWQAGRDGLKALPRALSRMVRYSRFESFVGRNLRLSSSRYGDGDRIDDIYDAILFGSDQVWNPALSDGFGGPYWGGFQSSARKIAWATSMNAGALGPDEAAAVQRLLKGFDAVSVREESLRELLQPLCARTVECLPDPTLLLDREKWLTVASPVRRRGYVLAYPMVWEDKVVQAAREIAAKRGLPLVILSKKALWRPRKDTVQWAGPAEFLSLVEGAACIVTSSFHGTAFSVIFRKPFLSIVPHGERNLRVESLLSSLALEDRLSSGADVRLSEQLPGGEDLDRHLAALRNQSAAFLDKALGCGEEPGAGH